MVAEAEKTQSHYFNVSTDNGRPPARGRIEFDNGPTDGMVGEDDSDGIGGRPVRAFAIGHVPQTRRRMPPSTRGAGWWLTAIGGK